MSLDAVKVLGINITISPQEKILEELQKFLLQHDKSKAQKPTHRRDILVIVTPNPEQVVLARRDKHFADIINRADVALPDGIGIVWAMRVLNLQPATCNLQPIPGVDMMEQLVLLAVKQRIPIALIGGRGGLAVKAFKCLQRKYSRPVLSADGSVLPRGERRQQLKEPVPRAVEGWAMDGPEVRIQKGKNRSWKVAIEVGTDTYFKSLASRIAQSGVGLVFVGLGAPKQEYVIEKIATWLHGSMVHKKKPFNHRAIQPVVLMSVGGAFDEISGRLPKPPHLLLRMRLKWFWRLVIEPWRIMRQLALLTFVWLVISAKVRSYLNEYNDR